MRLNKIALAAFAAVYIIWGSTYLAIRFGIETMPPWGLSAIRFVVAGAIMVFIAFLRKESKLTLHELKISSISGALLVTANGIVCVAEQWVPSGVAAVLVGAIPIWMMVMGWMWFQQARPTLQKILGSVLGLSGIAVIAAGDFTQAQDSAAAYGSLMIIASSWLWAGGTLIQKKAPQIKSVFMFSGIQMLAGSVLAILFSALFDRPWISNLETISSTSIFALGYLIIFGSLIAFTAYSWLSRNIQPHLISTYALVNPIIAVILGAIFYNEPIDLTFLTALVLVAIGLAMLVLPTYRIRFPRFRPMPMSQPCMNPAAKLQKKK